MQSSVSHCNLMVVCMIVRTKKTRTALVSTNAFVPPYVSLSSSMTYSREHLLTDILKRLQSQNICYRGVRRLARLSAGVFFCLRRRLWSVACLRRVTSQTSHSTQPSLLLPLPSASPRVVVVVSTQDSIYGRYDPEMKRLHRWDVKFHTPARAVWRPKHVRL